jgi:hypothetical protein
MQQVYPMRQTKRSVRFDSYGGMTHEILAGPVAMVG